MRIRGGGYQVAVASSAIHTYLNDHLAGAMFGSDLAEQIRTRSEGSPLGEVMASIAPQIEADRQTLIALMEKLGVSQSAVKQATTWMAEKASRIKFGDLSAGESGLGIFMALETLALGVQGKLALWLMLKEIADEYPPIQPAELDRLIERAENQHELLERERRGAGRHALEADDAP